MNIGCLLRGHLASAEAVYNSGFYFSRCSGCGADMIRSTGAWRLIPAGHRVVWKATPAGHSLEPDFGSHLPVLHRQANFPAVHLPGSRWNRALVAVRHRSSPAREAYEREGEASPPLILIAVVWAGLQILSVLRPREA